MAKWEAEGKLTAVVTQNIDGLHQMAGSKTVYELHGSVHRNHCMRCGKFYGLSDLKERQGIPRCGCGGIIKPDVVLYEESLDEETMQKSLEAIASADMLIIGGTSLSVYPAAGLVHYYSGNRLVLINRSATPMDSRADLVISDSIGKTLEGFFIMDIQVGDILRLKKQHPCGSEEWEVLRTGMDFRLKCCGCGRQVMLAAPVS